MYSIDCVNIYILSQCHDNLVPSCLAPTSPSAEKSQIPEPKKEKKKAENQNRGAITHITNIVVLFTFSNCNLRLQLICLTHGLNLICEKSYCVVHSSRQYIESETQPPVAYTGFVISSVTLLKTPVAPLLPLTLALKKL
jgi:hypothetical protein